MPKQLQPLFIIPRIQVDKIKIYLNEAKAKQKHTYPNNNGDFHPIVIGSGEGCDIRIESRNCQSKEAVIYYKEDNICVRKCDCECCREFGWTTFSEKTLSEIKQKENKITLMFKELITLEIIILKPDMKVDDIKVCSKNSINYNPKTHSHADCVRI